MDLNKDTRDRIFAAADQLFEQAERAAFPTVDAVRKQARVNMNDASAGMKEWRRAQTAQAAPVAVQVPETVQQAHGQALTALWQAAVDLANESLRAAQAGWEAERAEGEAINKQLGDAYETQAAELEALQARLADAEGLHRAAVEQAGVLAGELGEAQRGLATRQAAADQAEARTVEIERRAAELRAELDRTHQDAAQVRQELGQMRETNQAQVEALREKLADLQGRAGVDQERIEAATAERNQARQEVAAAQGAANQAREEAAALRGELHAMKEQRQELLDSLKLSRGKGLGGGSKGKI